MRVKLSKSVIVNTISNTEPVRTGSVVEVPDDEGRDLVKSGYAEETSAKVTAEAKQAPTADNKMAPDASTKETDVTAGTTRAAASPPAPTPVRAPAATSTAGKTTGTAPRSRR